MHFLCWQLKFFIFVSGDSWKTWFLHFCSLRNFQLSTIYLKCGYRFESISRSLSGFWYGWQSIRRVIYWWVQNLCYFTFRFVQALPDFTAFAHLFLLVFTKMPLMEVLWEYKERMTRYDDKSMPLNWYNITIQDWSKWKKREASRRSPERLTAHGTIACARTRGQEIKLY